MTGGRRIWKCGSCRYRVRIDENSPAGKTLDEECPKCGSYHPWYLSSHRPEVDSKGTPGLVQMS